MQAVALPLAVYAHALGCGGDPVLSLVLMFGPLGVRDL
jgi:hypothetical protein